MPTTLDIANYFLRRVDRESGDLITQLKLQKLVYYAQAWNLVFQGKPLFDEEIHAWNHGPVQVSLRSSFGDYDSQPIPAPEDFCRDEVFTNAQLAVLDLVWQTYGEMSASRLRKLTHAEKPWQLARRGLRENELSNAVISRESIQDFYQDYGSKLNGRLFIDNCLLNKNSPSTKGTLFLAEGEAIDVCFSKIDYYLNNPSFEVEARKMSIAVSN